MDAYRDLADSNGVENSDHNMTNCNEDQGYTPFTDIPYANAKILSAAAYQQSPGDHDGAIENNVTSGDEEGNLFVFGNISEVEDGYHYSFCGLKTDEDDYDETQPHEEIFYANGESDEVRENGTLNCNLNPTGTLNSETPPDFKSLAEQALQSLDFEYTQTIQMQRKSEKVIKKDDTVDNPMYFYSDSTVSSKNIDEGSQSKQTSSISKDSETKKLTKQIPEINTKAVSTAIHNISLKAPNLDLKFRDWNKRNQKKQQQPEHPIIPSKPLMAFYRQSCKAKSATANLTRSATLAESFCRLFLKINSHDAESNALGGISNYKDEVFVIHCIGADRVECQTRETISKAFAPIVKWMHQYQHFESGLQGTGSDTLQTNEHTSTNANNPKPLSWPAHVRIELLGPNVPLHSERFETMNLLLDIPGRLETATVICKNCMYHDYLDELERSREEGDNKQIESMQFPNLVIAYNAGIWGYTDWHPTLRKMDVFKRPVPFVITSYTMPEAEDDADVLEEILSYSEIDDRVPIQKRCLWASEVNPYASRAVRETRSSSNIYHENGAWQAYLMGS